MNLTHAASELSQRITQGPTLAFLILMLALLLGPKLAEKVRLPAMVGLVLAGMVLGPFGSRLLDSKKIALSALGTFGLLYLMFAAGLELDFKRLLRHKKLAITFALLSFAIPFSSKGTNATLYPFCGLWARFQEPWNATKAPPLYFAWNWSAV